MSGVSVCWTREPSNRKRTELMFLPCRSQKAFMSFSSLVLRLILKKTSLLLSVTLMLRCSLPGATSCCSGDVFASFSADMMAVPLSLSRWASGRSVVLRGRSVSVAGEAWFARDATRCARTRQNEKGREYGARGQRSARGQVDDGDE